MRSMPHPNLNRMTEDYLTLIWKAYEWPDSRPSTTDLAASLGVTKSTVSANLKRLARDGYLEYEPYGAIDLTDTGRRIAVEIVRRHRLIETYLVQRLGLSWDEVHEEADALEHSVSDLVLDRMEAELGHPRFDPHGDPIPSSDGTVAEFCGRRFATLEPGDRGRLVRVDDTDPAMLTWLREQSVELGVGLELVARRPFGGPFEVRVTGGSPAHDLDLGPELADALWVDDVVEGVFHRPSTS
jgi:DtxR family transcriptional regulator, Mn-dependent transcriptional regulator